MAEVTIPTCQAQLCDGVADDRSRLCAEHRRALTLTTKIQDAVREYLNGNLRPYDALRPTAESATKIVEAGEYLRLAMKQLISAQFDDVKFQLAQPIYTGDLALTSAAPWRINFVWQGDRINRELHDDSEENCDDSDSDDMT